MVNRLLSNQKSILQVCMWAGIAFMCGVFGYYLGSSSKLGHSRSGSLWSSDSGHGAGTCQGYDEGFERGRNPSYEGKDSDYYSVLEKYHLEEKARRMSAVFSRTELGHALAQGATLVEFGPNQGTPEGRIVAEALKLLESEPLDTLSQVRESIERLGLELTSERQFLIQLAAKLDLDVSIKVEFLSEQFAKASAIQDSKQNKLNCSTILVTLMQIGADPSQVEASLRQVLAAQTSYHIRSYLIGIYEARYPEQGRRIRDDLGMQEM